MDRIIKMSSALACCALLFGAIAFATSGSESAQPTIEAEVTTTQASTQSVTVQESVEAEQVQVQNVETDEELTQAQVVVTTTQEVEETTQAVESTTQEVEETTQAVETTTQAIVQVSEKVEQVTEEETTQEVEVEQEQDVQDSIITVEKDEVEIEEELIEDLVDSVFDEVQATVSGNTGESLVLAETSSSTPSKVTSLKFTQSHNDEVTIYWPAASNATGYEVYVSADGGATFTLHQKTSSTSYVCDDLDSTTDYQFKIVAYNGSVYGEYSNVFSYTIESANGIYNLDAENITDTNATLTWDEVEGATYKIEYKSTYTWTTVATVTTNSYDISGLTAGTEYNYRISAKLTGSTTYGTGVEISFKTVVGTVALSIASSQDDEIEFEWSSVTGATAYEVYVAVNGGSFALVDTQVSTGYSLDRDENNTYEVKVRAIDASTGETVYGAFSESIKIAGLLQAVTNLQEVTTTDYTTKISWDAVEGASEYRIYKYNSYGNYWYASGTTTATSFSEPIITTGVDSSRVYKVAAIDEYGIPGIISDAVMATTSGLTITFSTTKTTISWPAVSGAKLYVVSMKSLDGLTYTEQVTSTTNSATLYLPADSTVTLIVKAYSDTDGETFISNAVSEFQVATPELYLYSSSDDYDLQLSSLRSELIYFTQVINNTKYYDGDVTMTSESIFSMSASDFKLDGTDVTDILEDLGGSLDFGDEETETNIYSFSDGEAEDSNGRTLDLDESFVPFENDAYLYNAQDDSVNLANYISLTTIWNKDEHYITENADGTYSITFTIYLEQNKDWYHSGFTTVFGDDDLGDDSFAITNAEYGATTINATFTDDGYLLTLEVVSPFVFSATASLSGSELAGNLSMTITGTTTYKYTFTYN